MTNWQHVRSIATKTRNKILKFSWEDLREYPSHSPTLACWCAISSMALKRALWADGVKTTIVTGHFAANRTQMPNKRMLSPNHSWLMLDDSIIDITATQFGSGLKAVTIVHGEDVRWAPLYIGRKAIEQFRAWPPDQTPLGTNKIAKILKFN